MDAPSFNVHTPCTATVLPFRPRVGQKWFTAGGVYGGRTSRGHLIVGLRAVEPLSWLDAMGWAVSRVHDGFDDWSLPSVEDLLLLREQFPAEAQARFWTHERVGQNDALIVMLTPPLTTHWGIHHSNTAVAVRYHQTH